MKDQYLINMQFAEELLEFIHCEAPIFGSRTLWSPRYSILELEMDVSLFHEEIGMSVFYIITENLDDVIACYEDFILEINVPADHIEANFTRCALDIAPFYFSKGYNHGAFLGYCAMVMGVAYNFLFMKPSGVPLRACQVIGLVLFMHQMTGEFYKEGGWRGLRDASSNFNNCLEDSRAKRKGKH